MTEPDEFPLPPPEADAESGVLFYVQLVLVGPLRQRATQRLMWWLTEQMTADADPGDYGSLFRVWADIEDLADAFQDGATFGQVAPIAAGEWQSAHGDPAARAAWVARWDTWLTMYGKGHAVHRMRPGVTAPSERLPLPPRSV